jgi:hypothetical protein
MSTWVVSSGMDAAAEAGQIQQRQAAHALLSEFFQQVPQGKCNNERGDYKGDRIALKSFSLPASKQLPAYILDTNYFHHFLQHCDRGDDDTKLESFMACKMESQRFLQWAGADTMAADATRSTMAVARSAPHALHTLLYVSTIFLIPLAGRGQF